MTQWSAGCSSLTDAGSPSSQFFWHTRRQKNCLVVLHEGIGPTDGEKHKNTANITYGQSSESRETVWWAPRLVWFYDCLHRIQVYRKLKERERRLALAQISILTGLTGAHHDLFSSHKPLSSKPALLFHFNTVHNLHPLILMLHEAAAGRMRAHTPTYTLAVSAEVTWCGRSCGSPQLLDVFHLSVCQRPTEPGLSCLGFNSLKKSSF